MMDFDSLVDDNQAASVSDPVHGLQSFDAMVPDEEKYGGVGQQLLTGVEGAAQGFAGPLATGAERLLSKAGVPGLTPEDQAGRKSANPWTHGIGELGGFGAGALTGTGEAALLEHAGAALAPTAESIGRLGSIAAKGAIEGGLIAGGDEISNRINNDPEQTAGSVIAHVGLGSVLGAGGAAALGAIFPKWMAEQKEPVEQAIQDFKNSVTGTVVDQGSMEPLRTIADVGMETSSEGGKEVMAAANRNQWPVLEGMVSDDRGVQMAEDSLLNAPPTIAAVGRRKLYQDASDAVTNDVQNTIGSSSGASETEVGNNLKQSLLQKLQDRYAPIKALYDAVEPYREAISLSDKSTGSLSGNLSKMAETMAPGLERYNFTKAWADKISGISNLKQLAELRSEMNKSAGPMTKDIAQDINERLNGVEERAIKRFAKTMKTDKANQAVSQVLDNANKAKAGYRAFREQLQELGNNLGKKKIYGPQNFMDFLDNLNPQTLTRRLFNENNTEFAQYFAKEFPEEMASMREYQRGLIRQGAMKDGEFNARKAVKSILEMEPETRRLLFSPEEIQKVQDADTYLKSFPKSFNPSGTAHETAFRHFFESPTASVIANLRDGAMLSYVKMMGRMAPGAEKEAGRITSLLGKATLEKDPHAQAMKNSVQYLMSAIRGDRLLSQASRAVFVGALPEIIDSDHDLGAVDKRVKEFSENPDLAENVGGHMGHYLPNHDIAIKGAAANAAGYLNSIRPSENKNAPLDKNRIPSSVEKSKYQRALKIANQPLTVLSLLKQGRLSPEDVNHLDNLYPGFANQMRSRVFEEMTNHQAKGNRIPYPTRIGLSHLLQQPLDSSITPQSVQMNQSVLSQSGASRAQGAPAAARVSKVGIGKMGAANRLSLHPPESAE